MANKLEKGLISTFATVAILGGAGLFGAGIDEHLGQPKADYQEAVACRKQVEASQQCSPKGQQSLAVDKSAGTKAISGIALTTLGIILI